MTCNLAGFHWRDPARWMYYHLLDGDWASNVLSWQWVAGTFSSKKYIANQENINTYTNSKQRGTYLDTTYEAITDAKPPAALLTAGMPELKTVLPANQSVQIDTSLPTMVYNYYNLSPVWRKEEKANHVLLLEPSVFDAYPVSEKCMAFALEQSKNIEDIQVFVGSFTELQQHTKSSIIYYREHPLSKHYKGNEDAREWMIQTSQPVQGSFFSFWKKYERQIEKEYF
jgi:deoxyribodipyrimidine photo-lyase